MCLPLERNNSLSDTAIRHCKQPICGGLHGTSRVVKVTEPFDLVPPNTTGGIITSGCTAYHVCLIAQIESSHPATPAADLRLVFYELLRENNKNVINSAIN